ncbi:hypothetical protein [Shewanella woodyi]|uniref:Uncharacterized protein n=1 Tax=Shewanella woodyi (strain ATCC 51908 / MS32) TaxID=392500 RepID=B1KHD7_SHEWM|nr:hypothetical protein [Shewanella woodyi]ACA85445.1 hypothetical protein Swoo_1152 [Shewanella woodyi ATCC 51908]
MRETIKQKLDSELRNKKFKQFIYFFFALVTIAVIVSFIVNRAETKGTYVIGHVVNRHTKLHDEGHTNYLIVEVPTENKLVYVRVPTKDIVKVNTKVQLRRMMKTSSGKSRYIFLKYIEQPPSS